MDKTKAIEEFSKSLRVCLNHASMYFGGHPILIKSLTVLKSNLDTLFTFLSPIRIEVRPDKLIIGDTQCNTQQSKDLAIIFHRRKIKVIEINQDVTSEELSQFVSGISLSMENIAKGGGVATLLKFKAVTHISVEELDYSPFLKGEGDICTDVWGYLLQAAIERKDTTTISEFVANFENIIAELKLEYIAESNETQSTLGKFLTYLRENEKDNFIRCARILIKAILMHKDELNDFQIDKLSLILRDFQENDWVDLFIDEILTDESIDPIRLQFLYQFMAKEKQKEVSSYLLEKVKMSLQKNPRLLKRIKELFTSSIDTPIFEIYRHAISSFLEDSGSVLFYFNHEHLMKNYRTILLNLLSGAQKEEETVRIIERVLKEVRQAMETGNYEFAVSLIDEVAAEKDSSTAFGRAYEELIKEISAVINEIVLKQKTFPNISYFIERASVFSLNIHPYLDKIFKEKIVNADILRMLFKFFPQNLELLYRNIRLKVDDIGLMRAFIANLMAIDSPLALDILKNIFSSAGTFIKRECLRSMKGLSYRDREFLFSLLLRGDAFLKRESLSILVHNEDDMREALKIIFSIPNPLGLKNSVIVENLKIIEELDLRAAEPHLRILAEKKLFWNKNIRKKAKEILQEWNMAVV